jgi:hypothetical protein
MKQGKVIRSPVHRGKRNKYIYEIKSRLSIPPETFSVEITSILSAQSLLRKFIPLFNPIQKDAAGMILPFPAALIL